MSQLETGFTNVQALDPSIIVDLRYATTDNFTHQVIYHFTTAIARTGSAKKLARASALLQEQGYRLKIWDAYRPVAAQARLYDIYPDPSFVAKPNPNFSHQKGVTFDVTLCDAAGKELDMQTAFDDFTVAAHRDFTRTPLQEKHYQILDQAMQAAGFFGYENEWWDYRDTQMDSYPPATADPNDFQIAEHV